MSVIVMMVMVVVMVVMVALCTGAKVKKHEKAQIEAVLMDPQTGEKVNASYYFGIYGDNSLFDPASGHLVHVQSEGGSNRGCSDYNHDLPTHDWIALIERGQCYFTEKINTATKQYNASAVIVYNNAGTALVTMQSSINDEVYVFVKQSVGRRLAVLADSQFHVHINITKIERSSITGVASPSAYCHVWVLLLTPFCLWLL